MNIFENSLEVCHCNRITLGEIKYTIENGATTLKQLQESLSVGTQCRCCMFEEADHSKIKKELYCDDILNYYKER